MRDTSLFPQGNVRSGNSSNPVIQSSSGRYSDERGGRASPKMPNGSSPSKANDVTNDTGGSAAPAYDQKNPSKASVLVNGNNERPTVLAWQLTQTTYSDANLWCYLIAATEFTKDSAKPRLPMSVETLLKTKLVGTNGCIFTDYQKHVVSTIPLGENTETILRPIGKLPWSTMLKFLDSAKLPGSPTREALICIFNVLVCQMYQSQKSENAEQNSFKVLDVKQTKPSQGQPLATVIDKFLTEDPKNLHRLETYLKGRRAQISYQKRADSAQASKDSVEKSIVGLARVDDARESKVPYPPKVSKYGASSDHVSFFIKPNRKSKTATASASSEPLTNRYATVAEYFKRNKGQRLRNPDLPVINVGTRRKPIYLPPEFCGLKNSCTTSEMDHNDLEALARAVDMQNLLGNRNMKRDSLAPGLKLQPDSGALNCCVDVTVASTLMSCRLLESPKIEYTKGQTIDTSCGSWETNTFKFAKDQNRQPRRLAMLRFSPSQIAEVTKKEEEILKNQTLKSGNLRSKLSKYGILLDESTPIGTVTMQGEKPNKAEQEIIHQKLKELAKPESGPKPDALLVVLPKKEQSVYDCVKHQCDTVLGIQSLCVVAFQLTGEGDGYYSQVGLKLNLKLNGQNQELERPDAKSFTLKTTMIVGFDTMVPPIGTGEGAKSIATMVTSNDESLSQWPARVEVLAKKPVHKVLEEQLQARVDNWNDMNREYPKNIIVYINGSRARTVQAFPKEFSDIETSLRKNTKSERLNLTLIAVSKDHNAKFRTPESLTRDLEAQKIPKKPVLVRTRERDGDKTWEFVIQGHKPMKKTKYEEAISQGLGLKANQATLPVRYSVLKHGSFTTHQAREELENLTHEMCYLSGHATSYVTETLPIHYVGLLCKRIHSYVRPWYYPRNGSALLEEMSQETIQPHGNIMDTMYYA